MGYANAATATAQAIAKAIAPRRSISISAWAVRDRILTKAETDLDGEWKHRNPLLVEPMDCMSPRSGVHEVACMFPIQFGKTMIASNVIGHTMVENPCPIMVCLPGEVTLNKWVQQKLNPMLESPAIKRALASTASRDASNTRTYKEFSGEGQLYIEHAGSPSRLKSSSIRILIVDELDEFAANLATQDDPLELLDGRTSAFPTNYKRLYISTPGIAGVSRIEEKWRLSDQRRWYVPCPHCGHFQPLELHGLQGMPGTKECWYMCRECTAVIEEHHKTQMIGAGRWVPEKPGAEIRGYTANFLYYQFGMGPRWGEMLQRWRSVQRDPAKLKTFINDRLAEVWEDRNARKLRDAELAERGEPYRLRTAPPGVLVLVAGVDTQDDRLAVQIIGLGRGMECWVIDYVELDGDPAEPDVWARLTDLINRPIEYHNGALMSVEATAIDAAGHRTEHVYNYVRQARIRRPMAIFGAKPANAPILGRPKLQDVNYKGQLDKGGIRTYQVGTVKAKDVFFQRLGADVDRPAENRMIHLSADLDEFYLEGLVSEVFNPSKGRYEKKRGGGRNEPLDTWVYAYAAAHHQTLRVHRFTGADWDAREKRLQEQAIEIRRLDSRETSRPAANDQATVAAEDSRETPAATPAGHSARAVIDRILCRIDRDALACATAADLQEWGAVTHGTAMEVAALEEMLGQLQAGDAPIADQLGDDLIARARAALRVDPAPRPQAAPRYRRGVRNRGIR